MYLRDRIDTITFSKDAERNRDAMEHRAGVLFLDRPFDDPDAFFHRSGRKKSGYARKRPTPSFALEPAGFLRRARASRPDRPEATASAFSSWVYSLYASTESDPEAMREGLAAEASIAEIMAFGNLDPASYQPDERYLRRQRSPWDLVHNGLHVGAQADVVPWFAVEHLRVGGEPLRASPDLVYRNARSGTVIIVEIKYTRRAIPPNLWPNVWAQLWCYAQIPFARAAQDVTVVGEMWGATSSIFGGAFCYMRASVRRDPRLPVFDRFFRSLFKIYSGG